MRTADLPWTTEDMDEEMWALNQERLCAMPCANSATAAAGHNCGAVESGNGSGRDAEGRAGYGYSCIASLAGV